MRSSAREQQAAVVVRDGSSFRFVIKTIPIPTPTSSEFLVRLSATGICGTDIGLASGKLGPCCDILGHEGVGRVTELPTDSAAAVSAGIKNGDRVGVAWVRDVCGRCTYCLAPDGETRCAEQMNSGRKIDGTFAEYAIVPARYVIRVPETIADEDVAPILCGGVTAYKALKIAGTVAGQWIAVMGAGGGVGALAVQYAKAMGYRVLAFDMGKADVCSRLKPDAYVDVNESTLFDTVSQLTDSRMIQTVIAAAGSNQAYELGMRLLAPFGTLVCVGIPPPDQTVNFHPLTFIDKGIRILGSAVGTRADIAEALEFVQRGVVKPTVQRISMEDIPAVADSFAQATAKYVVKMREEPRT